MDFKFLFYQQYGVEEYYIYDPDELTLQGWQRHGNSLVKILQMGGWVSPRLGIRFEWQPRTEAVLYRPNGQRFLSSVELEQRAEQAQQRTQRSEQKFREAVPRLLALGLSVEQVAASLGLAIESVQTIADSP